MPRFALAIRVLTVSALVGGFAAAAAATGPAAMAAYPISASTPYKLIKQYDPNWCGPASTEIALTTWGKPSTQAYQHDLAVSEHTIANGETDSIAIVTSVMNNRIGEVWYYSTYINGSVATSAEKAALKSNILGDIASSKKAMVANVYGEALDVNNKNHAYWEGHYVAIVGYRNSGAQALIADPAYGGTTYYMDTNKLADWIARRGYNW